jgi:hypothetical protein
LPFLGPIEGELAAALLTVGIGVVMEKHYVSWWSVGINVLNLIVALMTLSLDQGTMILLGAYTVLGFVSAAKRWKWAYFLFGSKTYGSFMLALGSLQYPSLQQWVLSVADALKTTVSATSPLNYVLFGWAVFFIAAHVIGVIYNKYGPQTAK